MRKINLILGVLLILLNLSISKADWIDKGQYFEMDSTDGEIKDFKISEDGKIWAVNNQNEILNFDFATGKLISRYQCKVNSNLQYKKISKDVTNTIFVHFKMPREVPTTLEVNLKIYNNTNKNIVLDTIVKIELKSEGETDGIIIREVDYSIKNQLLLLNLNYGAGGYFEGGLSGGRDYNNFIVINIKDNKRIVDLNLSVESHNVNLSKEIEEFYFIGNEFSTETNNSGTDYTSTSSKSYFQKFNLKEQKVEKLIDYNYSTFRELNSGNSSTSGNPSFFQELLQTQNDSLLYLIFNNRLQNNDTILYIYDKFEKKNIDSLKINESIKNYKLDNKDFLHVINDKTYKIKLINETLITLDSLDFPEYVFNNQFYNNGEQTFVFFTDNISKLNYFTTENLKNISSNGFVASKILTGTNSKILFKSLTSNKGFTFEWEVEPGIIIKTSTNYLEYSYQKIGKYDVKLKIIDKQGKEYYFEKLKYITIYDELIADFDYTFDKDTRNCFFKSKSIGIINSYKWDFGDKSQSYDENPIHYYTNDGDYTISLIISNGIDNDTISKIISIEGIGYIKLKKNLSSIFKLDKLIKPEQYFINNDILKIFSYDNKYNYYPKDRWRDKEYYELFHAYNIQNLDLFNLISNYEKYYYDAFKRSDYPTFFSSKVLDYNDSNIIVFSYIENRNIPKIYYQKNYMQESNRMSLYNTIKPTNYIFSKNPPKLSFAKFNTLNNYSIYEEINGNLIISAGLDNKITKNKEIFLSEKLHQITISQMNDSLLVVYSDSTHNYSGKLILDNQNIDLFSNLQLDSTFIFSHTKLINNKIILLGYKPKSNSTIAKVYVYNLQSKTIKDFELPIFKNIEDITFFNQNLIVSGVTINMSGYVLFEKDFSKFKFIYIGEFLGQVKKLHLKNNVLTLVCEKQNNKNYDIFILQDTLDDTTSNENELVINTDFLIFPNPASEKISLDLGGVELADLVIYDILGNEIMSIPNYNSKSEIDISTIPIGTYTIQVQTNIGSIRQRFVKY